MAYGEIISIFRIFDEAKAREFYCDFLGFKVDWEHRFEEGLPIYMQVDAFCQELNDKKYKYARPGIQEMPWGAREMTLNDPFGNKLIFYKNV